MNLAERLPSLRPIEDPFLKAYEVDRADLKDAFYRLKEDVGDHLLLDLTLVEYDEDFCGVYHLMNEGTFELVRIVVRFAKDDMVLPSLSDLYPAANEMEREAYDLFGVHYEGHPNLTRILCPDDFVGHPLRKDYVNNTRD